MTPNARPTEAATLAPRFVDPPGSLPLADIDARQAAHFAQFRHDNTLVPLAPRPGEAVEVWATCGSGLSLARATVFYTVDGSAPTAHSAAAPMEIATVDWEARAGYLTRWRAALPARTEGTTVRYRVGGWRAGSSGAAGTPPDLWAQDGQGFWFRYPAEKGLTTFAYRVEAEARARPAWVRDAVIYHIFLDRFHPGTPDGAFAGTADPRRLHGGTLRGILQALPYLAALGVTCLWLSPLCTAETYHRYDSTDLYSVDPALGTEDDLRDLTAAAHERGMRVLLDLVPSHCSWHHPAFEAARRDPSAPTASWFTFEQWPDQYRNFLNAVPHLPSFNTDDPGARAHVIGSAVHWLRDCGVDGFRLDHAIGPGMDFWVALRAAIRTVNPDAFTVGEATDTPDCLRRYRGRLDGVLDFPLAGALSLTFASGAWSVAALDGFLDAHTRYMAEGPGRVSFLDNHDMTRFLFLSGGDTRRLKLAALCQFTLDATPTIYYGTEVGLTQQHDFSLNGDAEARRDMPWNPRAWDHDLLAFYRALTRLRRAHPVLRDGTRRTLHLDEHAGTYAYVRSAERHDAEVLALFNLSPEERTIVLPASAAPPSPSYLLSTGAAPDVRSTPEGLAVTLAPLTGSALGTV